LLDGSRASAPRVIFVGLGSGAMPAFFARKFPRVVVEVRSIHWSPYDRVGEVNADP
jgi:hypothetical protein